MDKLKSAFSKFKPPGSHSKLYKGMGNPFMDGPSLEEPTITKPTLYLLATSIFFTFLSICCMGAVAGFQAKWVSVSGLTGFALFCTIVSFLLAVTLLVIPLVYDRYDKLKRAARFLREQRALFIFYGLGTGLMLVMSFAVTISAFTQKGCKNPDDDPNASLGDDFKNGLSGWCRTKKAAAIFMWLSFGAWFAILILTLLKWRRTRNTGPRDEPFIPPSSPTDLSRAPSTFQSTLPQHTAPIVDQTTVDYGYSREESGYDPAMGGRASVDPYGAFGGDGMPQPVPTPAPGGLHDRPGMPNKEPSRTMQLAYDDPYANIRASLGTPVSAQSYAPAQYQHGGLPAPPEYGGYR